jgi:hypothetical protein
VFLAEKTHRRLLLVGKDAISKEYFTAAQEIYKFSTYFEGEFKDTK